jgi:hypothetical protein
VVEQRAILTLYVTNEKPRRGSIAIAVWMDNQAAAIDLPDIFTMPEQSFRGWAHRYVPSEKNGPAPTLTADERAYLAVCLRDAAAQIETPAS